MQPTSAWAFLWRCVDRAGTETREWIALDVRTLITFVVLFVLGLALQWRVRGAVEAKDDFVKWIVTVATPFALFAFCLIVFNLARAPFVVLSEQSKAHAAQLKAIADERSAALAERDALHQRIQQLEDAAKAAKGTHGPASVPALEQKLSLKERARKLSQQIIKLVTDSEEVKKTYRRESENKIHQISVERSAGKGEYVDHAKWVAFLGVEVAHEQQQERQAEANVAYWYNRDYVVRVTIIAAEMERDGLDIGSLLSYAQNANDSYSLKRAGIKLGELAEKLP
jgi:uncharacterized membrane protein